MKSRGSEEIVTNPDKEVMIADSVPSFNSRGDGGMTLLTFLYYEEKKEE